MTILKWVLALALAGFMAFMGLNKFMGDNPVFSYIAWRSDIAQFEPLVRMATGVGEFGAAALLILPATRRLGAMLAIVILIGAIGFHLSPWLGINAPVALAEGATPPYDTPADYVKSPFLFYSAIGALVAALANFALSGRR